MPVLSNPRHERELEFLLLPAQTHAWLLRMGFYDPTNHEAFLDHVKRTSPKPRLRAR